MRHVVLHNERLKGVEYGTLDSFENTIQSHVPATAIPVPAFSENRFLEKIGHGTRWSFVRSVLPKKKLEIDADVIWSILMGPENFELDLFKEWELKARYRIVYLFDTLEPQFPLIRKLFSDDRFNIRITSFHDAVPALESLTGRKWHAIEQAVPDFFFQNTPEEDRVIDFSSYGRRLPGFHEALKEFCEANKLRYEYSGKRDDKNGYSHDALYRKYAWDLTHSKFTISWPVEITNPKRAGKLNPVTCRWFEGAAAGTVIMGKKPDNPLFDTLLAPDLVVELDPFAPKKEIWKVLEHLYQNYSSLADHSGKRAAINKNRWCWKNRVERILELAIPSPSKVVLKDV